MRTSVSNRNIGETTLLNIPYRGQQQTGLSHAGQYYMQYYPRSEDGGEPHPTAFTDEEVLGRFSMRNFSKESSFVPDSIAIREWSNQRYMRRLVILGNNKQHYQVFKPEDLTPADKETVEDVSMS